MKNMKKLVALFAATTMAMSLSVSAFAASYADGTLTLEAADFTDTGAQKTMMAYVVDGTVEEGNVPAYDATAHTMIALNQDADLTGAVPVNADAVTEGSTIVIKTSGSNGSVNTILLAQEVTPVTYNVTYANVTDASYPPTVEAGTTLATLLGRLADPTLEGSTFSHWSATENGAEFTAEELAAEITADVTLYAVFTANVEKTYKITGYIDDAYATVTVGETTVNVASDGAFEIAGLENGTYSVVVKAPGALNRTLSATINGADVALSTDTDKITLMYGATSSDAESIGLADLLLIKTNYNVASGEEGYNINLDFNRDGTIGLADLLLVKTNYNKTIADAYNN